MSIEGDSDPFELYHLQNIWMLISLFCRVPGAFSHRILTLRGYRIAFLQWLCPSIVVNDSGVHCISNLWHSVRGGLWEDPCIRDVHTLFGPRISIFLARFNFLGMNVFVCTGNGFRMPQFSSGLNPPQKKKKKKEWKIFSSGLLLCGWNLSCTFRFPWFEKQNFQKKTVEFS